MNFSKYLDTVKDYAKTGLEKAKDIAEDVKDRVEDADIGNKVSDSIKRTKKAANAAKDAFFKDDEEGKE